MSDENGANLHPVNQPGCEASSDCIPKTYPRQLEHGQFHTYKLRTTPVDVTSPIYELSIPFCDEGTPEEWIKFRC
eukprot:7457799-Ditylum_brightwellii.AAC.1